MTGPTDRTFEPEPQAYKYRYALHASAMISAGAEPDLLDEVGKWRTDDLWTWALAALVTYVGAAAARTSDSVAAVCRRIAARHGLTLVAS